MIIVIAVAAVGLLAIIILLALLGKPKNEDTKGLEPKLYRFLEAADEAYILVYSEKKTSEFAKYADKQVVSSTLENSYIKPIKLFGSANYRTRNWELIANDNNVVTVKKYLQHKKIKAKNLMTMTLGDDVVEMWTLLRNSDGYVVTDIERLERKFW